MTNQDHKSMRNSKPLLAAFVATVLGIPSLPAHAENAGVEVGQLTCDVAGGTGFIFGSSKKLDCTFTYLDDSVPEEKYTGQIDKFGIDIGFTGKTVILWTVIAAEKDIYEKGSLAGTYGGATASAAFVAGLGANVLVGGSQDSFALQPVSISGGTGVNVAVGLAQVTLNKVQ